VNCNECLDRLDSYTERELSEAELREVKQHLEECPPCEDRYQFQADLKRLVKVCCDQGEAPPELRAKLREILF
jgi:mycothiol system anti-sigma-R factor